MEKKRGKQTLTGRYFKSTHPNRTNSTAIDVSRRDLSIGAKKSRYGCLLHGATLGANKLFFDPPETPLKVMLEGRFRSFLVGLTPNQDAYDATTLPERLYSVYTSVWRGMEGCRGGLGAISRPTTEHAHMASLGHAMASRGPRPPQTLPNA